MNEANHLALLLAEFKPDDLSRLLSISKSLSLLNFERYQHWKMKAEEAGKPAIYAYKGDVYQGLNPDNWNDLTLDFAQKHLRIISGLYGYLRPLDPIKPYRLDMGTPLQPASSKNLYDFWSERITAQISSELGRLNSDIILNLASVEYSKVVEFKSLNAQVITPRFLDEKNGAYQMISYFAKRARGLMASYVCTHRITNSAMIIGFQGAGYHYSNTLSCPNSPVFVR